MLKKVLPAFILVFCMVIVMFSVSANDSLSGQVNPFTGSAYTDESFYGNGTIIIILSHANSIQWREYTVDDFPELELESVYTHEPMDDEEGRKGNSEYRGFVDITLKDKSNEAVIAAIELLYKEYGDGIHMAVPIDKSYYTPIVTGDWREEYIYSQKGCGDANVDFKLNLADVSSILKYAAGWEQSHFNADNADVDLNGSVNISDAVMLLKRIAGWDV